MNRDRLWLALAILLPALAATIAPMSTIDLAYQVRAGELMLASGAVLRVDPFTFTAFGDPWLNQQWGAGVLFAAVHGPAGWGGLVVLRVVLVAAAVGLVAAGARRWLGPRSAALLALAGFLVGIASVGLRAQLFGIVLFAAVLAILAWRDRRPRLVLLIPLLVLAWANLHGSFFLGPAAVGVALVDDLLARRAGVRRLAAVLALSLVATFVNPFGPAVWGYALGIATNAEITRLITEWQRTSPLTVTGALFYASVVAAGALVWVARGRSLPAVVADARLARGPGAAGRLRGARRRVVGLRRPGGGGAHDRGAPAGAQRSPPRGRPGTGRRAAPRGAPGTAHRATAPPPPQRRARGGSRPRRRRVAATLARRGPADRPGRRPARRAGRPGPCAVGDGWTVGSRGRAAAVGVVVRVGLAGSAR